MKNVAIKSVGHAAILTAFETFHYDVRSVPRGSELPQRKPRGVPVDPEEPEFLAVGV